MIPTETLGLDWREVRLRLGKDSTRTTVSSEQAAFVLGGAALAFIVRYWAEAGRPQPQESSESEVSQLRRECDQLRRENEELRAKLDLLGTERQVSKSRLERPGFSDPHVRWIEGHRDELAKHPDSYFAVDMETGGIVERSRDEAELNRKLVERFKGDAGAWSRLLIVDASLYY